MTTNQSNYTIRNVTTAPITALIEDLQIAVGMKYVFLVQGILIVIINLTLVLFIFLRKHVRKSYKNVILASLFLSHCIVGVLCCGLPYQQKHMLESNVVDYGSAAMLASFCNLMLVSLDRFVAIRFPMLYSKMTSKTVLVALLIAWIVPVIYMLTTLVFHRLSQVAFVLVTSTSMVTLLLQNSLIYCIVRKQVRNIKRVFVSSAEALEEDARAGGTTTALNNNNKTLKQASHHKAFFICLAMVLSYVVAWLPATIYVLCDVIFDKRTTDGEYLNVIVFLSFCNSISDPIIYTWFNRKLKTNLKHFVSHGPRSRAQTQLSLMEN